MPGGMTGGMPGGEGRGSVLGGGGSMPGGGSSVPSGMPCGGGGGIGGLPRRGLLPGGGGRSTPGGGKPRVIVMVPACVGFVAGHCCGRVSGHGSRGGFRGQGLGLDRRVAVEVEAHGVVCAVGC